MLHIFYNRLLGRSCAVDVWDIQNIFVHTCMAAILLSLLHSNVDRCVFVDGHNIWYAPCLFYALSLWLSSVSSFFSVSFSNYPEVSFENTSVTFPSVIRTNVTLFCHKSD